LKSLGKVHWFLKPLGKVHWFLKATRVPRSRKGGLTVSSDRKDRFTGSLKPLGKVHWFLEAGRAGSLSSQTGKIGSLVP
jgi:hypothetical protein